MIKKVLQGSILLFLCFITLNSLSQEKCPFASTSIKPFFAGYPDRDSLLVTEILRAGKLDTKYDGFEVISFHISTDGNCLGSGLYTEVHSNSNDITGEAVALLKRATLGQKLFLDHVHIGNNSGQIYCSPVVSFFILKATATDSCQTLPFKAFFAGYPDSRSLTVEELLTSSKLVTNANGYEIVSFKVGAAISFEGLTWCGEITNNGPDFITDVKNLIRRGKGYTYFIDAIIVKNKAGQTFCLDSFKLIIR